MDELSESYIRADEAVEIISDAFEEVNLSNAEAFEAIGLMLAHLIRTSAVDKDPETSLQLLRQFLKIELKEDLHS
jgi:hypothetical protein